MKKILKSFVTLGALAGIMVSATGAFFTSTVTVPDNQINVGTLQVAVDTAQEDSFVGTWGYPNAYNVVHENDDGSITQSYSFIPWDNAAPDDTNTYTIGIRNRGTIPMNVRAAAVGSWTAGPRFGETLPDETVCPALVDADANLVSVSDVHLYAATPAGGCESDNGCRNLRDGLLSLGPWSLATGLTAGNSGPVAGFYYGNALGTGVSGNDYVLDDHQFAIHQVEATLSSDANNCYQGATYTFDLTVQGKQTADTWTP